MVSMPKAISSFLVGKGSITDFGDRYPKLDGQNMSSIAGLYIVGNIAGSPDIRAALNAGHNVGKILGHKDKSSETNQQTDHDVIIIGAGPAGLACAAAIQESGKNFVVLERKKSLATIRAFKPDLLLYNAVTGDRLNQSAFAYSEMTSADLLEKWEAKLAKLDLPIQEGVIVENVAKKGGIFHVQLKDGKVMTAKHVVLALGKLILLDKLDAAEEKFDCRQIEHSIAKSDEPETTTDCDVISRISLRMERQLDMRGITFLLTWGIGIVLMYLWLYYGPKDSQGRQLIPGTSAGVPGWFIYSTAYTAIIWIFGIRAMMRWNDRLQTKKFAMLIASQTLLFWAIPNFFFASLFDLSSPAGGYELGYIWPLAVKPENTQYWFNSGGWAFYMFAWNMALSFLLIPLIAIKHGKKYCSWVCGCGGLAETLGDQWRHFSPKGNANIGREKQAFWVTGFAGVATLVVLLNLAFPGARVLGETSSMLTRLYGGIVDVWLIAIIPVALYPFLGGKVWCRFWCPSALYMQTVSKLWPKLKGATDKAKQTTFGIFSRKERCIACNMCTRYCEVGIDVRKFAIKGTTFDNTNSSCIGCGICISVCPTETLSFDNTFSDREDV